MIAENAAADRCNASAVLGMGLALITHADFINTVTVRRVDSMLKLKLLTAAATAALFTTGGAVADNPRSLGAVSVASFEQLDRNQDGLISQVEWREHFRGSPGASAATGGATDDVDRSDVGARRGYPTAPTGGPHVGGPRVGDSSDAQGTPLRAGVPGEGARAGYPIARTGEPRVGGPRVLEQRDTQASSAAATTFSELDRNRDGIVTQAEWNQFVDNNAAASAGGATSSAAEDPSDRGARRGYPTARTGDPVVGGSRTEPR
jgi:hypothetical protein